MPVERSTASIAVLLERPPAPGALRLAAIRYWASARLLVLSASSRSSFRGTSLAGNGQRDSGYTADHTAPGVTGCLSKLPAETLILIGRNLASCDSFHLQRLEPIISHTAQVREGPLSKLFNVN